MKIAVIGMGYVGLPLGLRFAEAGVSVLGLDLDRKKVETINSGGSYIKHIRPGTIGSLVQSNLLEASSDFSRISEVEAVLICVPTPLNKNREPDISYVLRSGEAIASNLKPGTLVVLESTTYPGTTDTDLRQILEKGSGLKAGFDFYLAYSPEREDPGREDYSVRTIPKVTGGYSDECLRRCIELYSLALDEIHPVSSCRVAEATKLTENIFRSVNIALVNELKVVFTKMEIDVWDVIAAAATKPFGYMPFYPGPGLGGHCIPIDPFYLTWKAREFDLNSKFIELAGEINTSMPDYVIGRVSDVLNSESKPIRGSRILVLGIAYKPNVDDDRESPSYILIKKLEAKGAEVSYNDPFVPEIRPSRSHADLAGRSSVEIEDGYDCVLLVTHHDIYKTFDFRGFKSPFVDTRNFIELRPSNYFRA